MPFTKMEFSGRDRLMAKIVLSPTILAATFLLWFYFMDDLVVLNALNHFAQ